MPCHPATGLRPATLPGAATLARVTHNMARNNTSTATAATTVATRKAAQAANAHKYATAPRSNPVAAVAYTLTPLGAATAAAGGAGKGGKPTVMGCVAVAAATVAAKGRPLTGANIAAAMQALPALRTAIAGTKAASLYAAGGNYCHAWLGGYIAGAARNPACLLAKVTA